MSISPLTITLSLFRSSGPVGQCPPVHFIHVDRGVAPTMCLRRGFHLFGFRLDFLNTSRPQDEIRGLLGLRPRDNKRLGIGTQKFQPTFDIACRVLNRRILDPGCRTQEGRPHFGDEFFPRIRRAAEGHPIRQRLPIEPLTVARRMHELVK